MNISSLIPFLFIWIIPAFFMIRTYLKMNTEDQKSAMNDFKSRRFILTIGFMVMGAFLTHLGSLFSIKNMELIGIVFFTLGGILSAVDIWNKSKIKSVNIMIILVLTVWYL